MVLGLGIMLSATVPAFAADIVDQEVFDARWTGFYAGVFGGYHAGDITNSDCVGVCPADPEYRSWGGGIKAGYDYEFSNNVVLGAYALVPLWADQDSFSIFNGALTFTYEPKFVASLGARLGYDIGYGLLPYIGGGYTVARIEANDGLQSIDVTHHGVHLAVGLEYLLTDNVSTDLRYTHYRLGKEVYDFGVPSTWGENANAISVGVNYRF
ncbi:porin family protein [Aurantimonas sp. E1-2-R+4]|uniref:outer membrane protein n=1 Tax=Aurantimonas sp. E1-2-R+4 TaxID=3113714 RepID=UPI002F92A0D0